jgi:hypothetical protein
MEVSKIYAQRIFNAQYNKWNRITDTIYWFSKQKKIDPHLILAIYYIEDYFRPAWFQLAEMILLKAGLIKDPSIGPFQFRVSNFKDLNSDEIVFNILVFVYSLLKKSGILKRRTSQNFISFGELYNLDVLYGHVIFELYQILKKEKWKPINI